jgi:hypothetical protein
MNPGLFNKRYLAAGQYTIADMICYPWASQTHSWRDTDSNLRQASFNFDPPRFGAKRLEQQRDWRIWEKISRVQSGPFFFLKTPFAQGLRAISTGVKVGHRFTHKGVTCPENVDLGRFVLESWCHDSGARVGARR